MFYSLQESKDKILAWSVKDSLNLHAYWQVIKFFSYQKKNVSR